MYLRYYADAYISKPWAAARWSAKPGNTSWMARAPRSRCGKKTLQEGGWFNEQKIKKEMEAASSSDRKGKSVIDLGLDPLKISTPNVTAPPSPPGGASAEPFEPMYVSDDEYFQSRSVCNCHRRAAAAAANHQTDPYEDDQNQSPQPPPHPYRILLRRDRLIRQNWFRGFASIGIGEDRRQCACE
ncbi:hypothetical protein HDV00_011368 [Rhizophlyctis rosea]|nr:hypothetical protein HDV00_011368 [Rhizophlyctis rosea]